MFKKVLIITYSFPPSESIAAKRFGHMVSYFRDHGWEPWILTTNSSGLQRNLISEDKIFRISDHDSMKTNNNYGKISTKKSLSFEKTRKKINFKTIDRYMLDWYKESVKEIKKLKNCGFSVDIIVASYGPACSLWLGRKLSYIFNVPLIADYRDLGALIEDDRYFLIKYLDKLIERWLLKDCAMLTTVSKTLGEILKNQYKKKTCIIYNGWQYQNTNENIAQQKAINISLKYKRYLYYAGRIYEHRLNSFFLILDAIKYYENMILVIRSLGPEYLEKRILEYAFIHNMTDKLMILEPKASSVIHGEASYAVANIVCEDMSNINGHSKGSLTGKLFELIPLNPPIIAVARSDSEIGEILKKTNKGRLCANKEDIFMFLKNIDKIKNVYLPDIAVINQYSRKEQAKEFCDLLTYNTEN